MHYTRYTSNGLFMPVLAPAPLRIVIRAGPETVCVAALLTGRNGGLYKSASLQRIEHLFPRGGQIIQDRNSGESEHKNTMSWRMLLGAQHLYISLGLRRQGAMCHASAHWERPSLEKPGAGRGATQGSAWTDFPTGPGHTCPQAHGPSCPTLRLS